MKSIRNILSTVPDAVLRRGEIYYESESIFSLVRNTDGVFAGKVNGSSGETYKVKVQTSDTGEVSDYSCTCPYDYGDVCKHIVAVLLAIEAGSFREGNDAAAKTPTPSAPTAGLPELLAALPREQLLSIILSHTEEDEIFKSKLTLEISPPDIKSDLSIVKEKVRRSIRSNTRRGFIDYLGCDAICDELSDCLDFAEDRLAKGQILSAFEVILYILLTGADLASSADSSSGSLTFVMDDSFEKLEAVCWWVAENAKDAEKKTCYEKLCKAALNKVLEGWDDWSFDLLKIAAMLVTDKNKSMIDDALSGLRNRQKDHKFSDFSQIQEDMVKLKVIQSLDGEKAARAFIDKRLEVDQFRELAVDDDLKKGNYENAEKLCLEKTKQLDRRPYGRPSDWWYRLYEIYEKTNNRPKLLSTAKSLLLQGDIQYYTKMKTLLCEDGTWQEIYPPLRSELKTALPGFFYAQILDMENEDALLLEEVKRASSAVFQYGKKLAKHYPQIIYELYRIEITKAAKESGNRSQYGKLCGLIRELHQAGGKDEALALADQFIQEYKRRPAMLDELAKLKRKLTSSAKRNNVGS